MLVAHALGSPSGAQAPAASVEPVSVGGTPEAPLPGPSSAPAVSDDGSVVVFRTDVGDATRIAVRDRAAATTTLLDRAGAAPGVSGDGCVISYAAPVGPPADPSAQPQVELLAVDRCADPRAAVVVDTVDAPAVETAPALSEDGSVIAWSHGEEIVRYRSDAGVGGAWGRDGVFDTVDGGQPGTVTGPNVDVSDDGATVVFEAGPAGAPFQPTPANIHLWRTAGGGAVVEPVSTTAGGAPGAADSTHPTVSGNGALVTYASRSTDLAVDGASSATTPFVVLDDRSGSSVLLAADADRPAIAGDGSQVVYRRGAELRAVRWTSGALDASPVDEPVLTGAPGGDPAVTRHGRWVVFASADGAALTDDVAFHDTEHVWVVERPPPSPAPPVDLGARRPGAELTARITFENDAAFAIPVAAVGVTDPFEVRRTTCARLLRPAATCVIVVGVSITEPGRLTGELTITTRGWDPIELVTELTATGRRPATTTTTTTTTTTSPSSGGSSGSSGGSSGSSGGSSGSSGGSSFPSFPSSSSGGSTTSSGTLTTTTTTSPADLPTLDPASLSFPATIVDAGRRTATLVLTDPGGASVADVRLRPGGEDYSIVETTCAGVVPTDGCTIRVAFTPTATGRLRAQLVVELADGREIVAELTGVGAPPPTLQVVPDVARAGQVVTVVGDGFPADATVDLVWLDGRVVGSPTADTDGAFRQSVVVLPRTPAGPGEVRVPARRNRFDAVTASLLVSDPSGVPWSPALPGVGVTVGS